MPTATQVNPIEKAFADAKKLQERKESLFEEIAANRSILRQFSVGGYLTDEQVAWVEENYPKRELSDETIAKRKASRAAKLAQSASAAA